MALPPFYSARTRTSAVLQLQRDMPSSGIAEGLGLLGRAGALAVERDEDATRQIEASERRIAEREMEQRRQGMALDAAARLTETQVELAGSLAELEARSQPGGAGHVMQVRQTMADARSRMMSALPDDVEVRRRAQEQWIGYEGRVLMQAQAFEARQRVEKNVDDFGAMAKASDALILANPTPEIFAEQSRIEDAAIEMLPVNGNDRAKIRRERAGQRTGAMLSGLIEQGRPDAAMALLATPETAGLLGDDGVSRYRRLAENATEAALREQELAATRAQGAVRDEIELLEAQVKAGATDVGADRIAALHGQAKAAGLEPARLFELEHMHMKVAINREYRSVAALRDGITGREQMEAQGRLGMGGQIELAFMRERRAALLKEQAGQYRQDWNAGGAARLAATDRLLMLPPEDRVTIASEIDPGGRLKYAVELRPETAMMAVRGAEARKANPKLLPADSDPIGSPRMTFDQLTGGALLGMAETDRMAMLDLAKDIYANYASEQGFASFDASWFRAAINRALGRDVRGGRSGGGIGEYGGARVLLPEGVDEAAFAEVLGRSDFARAAEPREVVLRKYTPYWVADAPRGSTYQFRDASGALLADRRGGAFRLNVWPR